MAVGAAGIAMLAYQAMAHHGHTHSGTQEYVKHDHAAHEVYDDHHVEGGLVRRLH